jgi:DNA-binding NtrC family response regulator
METNEVNPLGSDRTEPADVRYVAATHQPLLEMITKGSFRRDLYERLAGIVLHLPPLRERPDDITDIGLAFVDRTLGSALSADERGSIQRWLEGPAARAHRWPGNVRELHNALRSVMLGLEPDLGSAEPHEDDGRRLETLPGPIRLNRASLDEATRWYVERVFLQNDRNYSATARNLGIDRATVRRHLERTPD